MFCSRSANNKINKLHERTKDGLFTINHQNIQTLAVEIFKTHKGFSQVSCLDLFHNYNEKNFYSF